jgi:NADH-quinone oxidoreductase subunit L
MADFLDFDRHPGLLYVIATLLPALSFLLLLLAGGLRSYLRRYRETGGAGDSLYNLLGGDAPGRGGAYVATAAIALAFVCVLVGFFWFSADQANRNQLHDREHEIIKEMERSRTPAEQPLSKAELAHLRKELEEVGPQLERAEREHEERWSGEWTWASITPRGVADPGSASALRLGYYIDSLAGIMFLMVTFIATLIHVFSIGYMAEENAAEVADHEVHTEHGHLHRRGRSPRFFMFLSLFCFSMLNLILASNLFQVFLSWELVGICSYLLVGFYFERQSASNAANKAFITNRVGDAGFVIGMVILWTYVGTFNFQELFHRLRAPSHDGQGHPVELAERTVRVSPVSTAESDDRAMKLDLVGGSEVLLFPRVGHVHAGDLTARIPDATDPARRVPRTFPDVKKAPGPHDYGSMPYWLLVAAGLGIFLGCVGKSAQFPLHVWLPDAMEGPTPVSALIHAATMVAAGVYLVARVFPLFTPEALVVIAYTGGITLFVAATVAIVMTDIKKVLAYSTVSQLGYMMLALGVGGWAPGMFHLITHAFFKALLFLCSGSVIYGCHHVQEMTRMGGLYPKMKITALTMLVGVLAIAGTPFFSGYYSKDAILAQALGYAVVYREHILLFVLPLATAGLTTFYMFRMWFMTFTGPARDEHVHEHAHESPWVMTTPLVALAFFSVVVAWGWPVWDPEQSWLEGQLHHAEPPSVLADVGGAGEYVDRAGELRPRLARTVWDVHSLAGLMALGAAGMGFLLAYAIYFRRALDPGEAVEQVPRTYGFLQHKWYFDELYSAIVVRPGLVVAHWCRWFDTVVIDGIVHVIARVAVGISRVDGWTDVRVVDGLVNLTARVLYGTGAWLRTLQTGYLRSYVLFLVLAAVGIWVVLYLSLAPAAIP